MFLKFPLAQPRFLAVAPSVRPEQLVRFVVRPSFHPQKGVVRGFSSRRLLLAVDGPLESGTVIAVKLTDGIDGDTRIELARVDEATSLMCGGWLLTCRWRRKFR